ncbi:bifunctional protein FolD 2 [Tanacetum coccineum]
MHSSLNICETAMKARDPLFLATSSTRTVVWHRFPLPKHINEEKVLTEISIDKDVDGFHPLNIGKLAMKAETRSSLHSQSTRTVVGTCY